jgi:hypothetical protein
MKDIANKNMLLRGVTMAVLKSKDGTELLVDCNCGCNDGVRLRIDNDDFDFYCFMSYINGSFYRDQNDTMWYVFLKKIKKILAIIRNKDFYYAEIIMNKNEFKEFKEYINSIE